MVTGKIDHRLDQVERRLDPQPDGQVFVCFCAQKNGYVNLPDGNHFPDCPAAQATDRDQVVVVRFGDARTD